MGNRMQASHSESSPESVIPVGPALDFRYAADFRARVDDLIEQGKRHIILDLSETTVLDSNGLGAVFGLQRRLTPLGGQILFAAPTQAARTVIRLTRCDKVFPTYSTVELALLALNEAGQRTANAS